MYTGSNEPSPQRAFNGEFQPKEGAS